MMPVGVGQRGWRAVGGGSERKTKPRGQCVQVVYKRTIGVGSIGIHIVVEKAVREHDPPLPPVLEKALVAPLVQPPTDLGRELGLNVLYGERGNKKRRRDCQGEKKRVE